MRTNLKKVNINDMLNIETRLHEYSEDIRKDVKGMMHLQKIPEWKNKYLRNFRIFRRNMKRVESEEGNEIYKLRIVFRNSEPISVKA